MRIRILDRILVAIAGLIILAVCAGVVAQVFFQVDMVAKAAKVLTSESTWVKIGIIAICLVLLLIGGYCFLVLFRHRRRKDRFIMQKMESGELAISLKAMETMVSKCLEQQKEIETQSIRLENQRDGLIIRIRGTVASGVSIPLTVDTLQKQIKQYVTACSGVEVKGIRVQIESSGEEAQNAPFAIDAPAQTPLLQNAEKAEKKEDILPKEESENGEEDLKEAEDIPVAPVKSTAESAMEAAENLKKEYEEEFEDDRPIHQRLFSTPEEPCIMPLPPEDFVAEPSVKPEQESESPATPEPAPETEEDIGSELSPDEKKERDAYEFIRQTFGEPEDFVIGEPDQKPSDDQE